MRKFYINKKGVTLVELIMVVALISIVMIGIFNMFVFGNKAFKNGSNQHYTQNEVRFALESMTNEIRYSKTIEIFDENLEDLIDDLLVFDSTNGIYSDNRLLGWTYVLYDADNDSIVKLNREAGATQKFTLTNNKSGSNPIEFQVVNGNKLEYYVRGTDENGQRTFEINSEIFLMNNPNVIDGSSGYVIAYQTPEIIRTELQAPIIDFEDPGLIADSSRVEFIFNKNVDESTITIASVTAGNNGQPLTSSNINIDVETISFNKYKISIIFVKVGNKPTSFANGDKIKLNLYDADGYIVTPTLSYSGGKWSIE
ncbi:PilW family protein [Acidaminobacter hydrogenoformans]|uniref:Prepilin-type N-terminal cleavage/methylation domain-containing protein n=1 Tax=Acidaminobacter hydrogenoformans DSM 2784 TaxID=1120920 RepID=A0A1G5S764_9FIRM|nr:prepilin-type N-terminal cleavage/methylation domain-containing protein [Acidaminobacter hydrogenoformans]SCZ81730.1 prepilin-type N-terminal cleavage/methylation domain-containing protein [Acidaminobacter hydrogenoformans DSM 2784]